MLSPLELFQFGGIDSRSNPLNYPIGRSLRCRNWVPKDIGILELRNGFSTVSMSGSTSTATFHSLLPYTFFDASGNETPYLVLGQGTNLRIFNIATGSVTSPTIKGTALASTAGFASYIANGKIHFGNGTDQKWFDGTTARDNGLRALSTTEVVNTLVGFGVGSLTSAMNSSITLTAGATGSFSVTVVGMLFYCSPFDITLNELGPAPNFAGTGRVQIVAANSKVAVAGMPDFSVGSPNQYKLISRTDDGVAGAYFCTNTSTAVTSCTRSGTTLTVISTAHGLATNDIVVLSGTTNFDSIYAITKIDNNTFTATLFAAVGQNATGSNTTGGTCKRIVSAAPATLSVDVVLTTTDRTFLANDQNRGIAVGGSGLPSPGSAFYASIYNPTAGLHVGNRIAIGSRINGTSPRYNVRITALPDLSGTDSEWQILLGRTGDSGQIPYPCVDSQSNRMTVPSGQTSITLTTQGALDGTGEMPTRNGIIPSGLNLLCRVADRIHGGTIGRPTVYRSATEGDSLTGQFVGRPEQSWAPTDIDTFPTGKGLRGLFPEDRGAFYATKDDGAIFGDMGTGFAWIGPWYGAGMAGQRSWCETPYGPYWVTGHKQLTTFQNGQPVIVSDEYQAALLAKIGDAFLSQVEMFHLLDVQKSIDKIAIKCLDSSGVPFMVFHDFRLRSRQSPEGQAYEALYSSPLATNFILTKTRDSAGFMRLWAGASSAQLYQLESGANDAGTEYSADAVLPISGGPTRPSIPEIRIYGDQQVSISIANRLDAALSSTATIGYEQLVQEAVAGEDGNSYYKYKQTKTKFNKGFIRLQLTSHSADGDLSLNDPPHSPLETYGRIYLGEGLVGTKQGI